MSAVSLSSLPWLGGRSESAALPDSERLVRFTSGPLAGEIAIAVWNDENAVELVYTQADWDACDSAAYQFDTDGDLVESTPDGGPSSHLVSWESVEVAS